jgi:phage terminase small subunit
MNLTDKQRQFCEEYLIDLNATQAAIRAGYSEKTANRIASENLSKPDIQGHLQQLQKKLQEKTGITQERVLSEYAKIAFFDIRKAYTVDGGLKNIHDFDDDVAGAIVGIESYDEKIEDVTIGTTKKIKIADKKGALDSLAKHLGMFEKDNEQQNKNITVNIV